MCDDVMSPLLFILPPDHRRGFDLLPWESGNGKSLAGGSLVHLSFIIFGYLGTGGGAEIALDLEHLLTVP